MADIEKPSFLDDGFLFYYLILLKKVMKRSMYSTQL